MRVKERTSELEQANVWLQEEILSALISQTISQNQTKPALAINRFSKKALYVITLWRFDITMAE